MLDIKVKLTLHDRIDPLQKVWAQFVSQKVDGEFKNIK